MNTQPIEKIIASSQVDLQVHSIFPTIQGEGPFVGQPALFVRMAGCNLQCPQCDTDYTTNRFPISARVLYNEIKHRLQFMEQINTNLIVITGGEPLRQNLGDLILLLLQQEYRVQLETNGTSDGVLPSAILGHRNLTIVCSPKTGRVSRRLEPFIHSLKYIISHHSVSDVDGLPIKALNHPNSPVLARPPIGFTGTVYVQPADAGDELINQKNLKAAIDSCMIFGYTLCIQTHKIIGMD